ncbi:hypothetical protein ACH5RR_039113 [Cinchona calisaya]|uniref:J domain-containing protein n=1 Tax=Cinchona calisaya TaxID=153742 RepID=A0ABD2Y2L6_9GENT
MADETPDPENPLESEPLRLKTLAEQKYVAGNLKSALKYAKRAHRLQPSLDALPEMLTAFKILRTATKPITSAPPDDDEDSVSATPAPPDYYKILQIERFVNINTIKKQYKKLALTLHPDKNPFVASEEAFKHVGEAFRVLSDKIRRKDYDARLRIAMQNEAEAAAAGVGIEEGDTFWTACSTCRLLHKFERKYLGHNLVCPSCKKSFKAVEVMEEEENAGVGRVEEEGGNSSVGIRSSERIKARKLGRMSTVGEVLWRSRTKNVGVRGKRMVEKELGNVGKKRRLDSSGGVGVIEGLRSRSGRKEKRSGGVEVVARTRTRTKKVKVDEEEMMTLAEMQMLAKKKVSEEKMKLKGKEKEVEKESEKGKEVEKESEKEKVQQMDKDIGNEEVKEKENEIENEVLMEKEIEMENGKEDEEIEKDREKKKKKLKEKEKKMGTGKVKEREKRQRKGVSSNEKSMVIAARSASKSSRDLVIEKQRRPRQNNWEIVAVEDSDFYNFDKDREERSFKRGQVWAIYDSGDGMPRHYALIDEVVSLNPFQVRLSWLEFLSNDEQLISWEKLGFQISCGRFKVSERASIKSLKMFSHLADCERAAREVYRIYPKKGSVWALYNDKTLDSGRNQTTKDRGCHDVVVFLTSYSEIHGLSMAYLEKVDGFKTIYKRKDIGAHAIRWLEKDDLRMFSHQIPGRKLSGEEAPGLPKDCWELDPASLPPDSLTIGWVDETVG